MRCPHCGQLIDDPTDPLETGEPGIIFDIDDAETETFSRVRIADLTGDPFNDWPLIVARFQHSLPWLVEVVRSDPALSRYLKNRIEDVPPPQAIQPSQLWLDLDAVRPHLLKIVQDGQFAYGYQSRIAEALGVPNSGNYRRRIQNVASALERTLIRKNSTSSNTAEPPRPEKNGQIPGRRAA